MKHVLLALGWYDPLLHEGVVDYAGEHDWFLNSSVLRSMGRIPGGWQGDGAIVHLGSGEFNEFLRQTSVPAVIVQSRRTTLPYPLVATTPSQTAERAFDYFRGEKGFRHFGMYGPIGSQRLTAFQSRVASAGFQCHYLQSHPRNLDEERRRVQEWLRAVPRPIAVYCNNDDDAARFIDLAMTAGFDVPTDVAVLGTDNTPLVCNAICIFGKSDPSSEYNKFR